LAGAFIDQFEPAFDPLDTAVEIVDAQRDSGEVSVEVRNFPFQLTDAQDQLFLALADRRDVGANCVRSSLM
jgi:hypothetical protein